MIRCQNVREDVHAGAHARAYEHAHGFLFSPPERAREGAYANAHEGANVCAHVFHT